jgi:hypothetical protein
MRRALLCFGVVVAACWRGGPPESAPTGNHTTQQVVRDYQCTITIRGYHYPFFLCQIQGTSVADFVLVKLGGSVRFHGRMHATNAIAYRFEGDVYCAVGLPCTEHVIGTFKRLADGKLIGNLGTDDMVVELVPSSGYGGQGYGGAAYGGAGYGGAGYGGVVRPLPGS